MQQLKIWFAMKQSTNLELNEQVFGVGLNVKNSHTHNNNHRVQKLTKRSQQSDKQSEQCSDPPKVPSLQILGLG